MLNFFRRNKRRYAVHEAARVLSGMNNFRWSEEEAKQVINHLITTGRLAKSKNIFWKGTVTLPCSYKQKMTC
jgi:hypothetical protein